jgi:hypothetical protein
VPHEQCVAAAQMVRGYSPERMTHACEGPQVDSPAVTLLENRQEFLLTTHPIRSTSTRTLDARTARRLGDPELREYLRTTLRKRAPREQLDDVVSETLARP